MSIRNKFCIALSIVMLSGAAYAIGQRPTADGFQMIDGKWLNGLAGGSNQISIAGLTAKGTTQAGAMQLTPGYAMFSITTVPANAGVALPACFAGTFITLYNSGVNTLNVYPSIANDLATGIQDTINGGASATLTSQNGMELACTQNGAWSFPASSGGGGGNPGGINSDVQYRVNATTFGGISGFTSNGNSATAANSAFAIQGTSTGTTTFLSANAGATNFDITFPAATGTVALTSGLPVGANPTATAGPAAINGSATTFLRSDGAPAVQVGSSSQEGLLEGDGATLTITAGTIALNTAHANSWTASQTFTGTNLILSSANSGTQCLQASSAGVVSGTGSACSGSSGLTLGVTTVSSNDNNQLLYTNGTVLNATPGITTSGIGGLVYGLGIIVVNQPAISITGTFNAAGTTFDAPLFMNIVNTASAAGSALFDFQVGGVSQLILQPNTNATLSIGDSTTPSIFRVYNTVDTLSGPTNYERAVFDWAVNSNVLTIGTQAGGTGTLRAVAFAGTTFNFSPSTVNSPLIYLGGSGSVGIASMSGDGIGFFYNGTYYASIGAVGGSSGTTGLRLAGSIPVGWWGGASYSNLIDTALWRDSTGTTVVNAAAFINSTAAQSFRVYNTSDNLGPPTTNYERGIFDWQATTNVLTIGTQSGGSGSTRNMEFVIGGTNKLDYGITNAGLWTAASGIVVPAGTNTSTTLTLGTNAGFSGGTSGQISFVTNTNNFTALMGNVAFTLASSELFRWTSSGDASGGVDTGLTRNGAGIIEVDSGTAGTFRDLTLRSLSGQGATTANACTGFALATGGSDLAGNVTYTSATTCSVTFAHTKTNTPACTVVPGSSAATVEVVPATTGFAVTFGASQTAFSYHCIGL